MFLENHYFGTYDECARCWRERDMICMTPERVVSWGREGGRPPDYMNTSISKTACLISVTVLSSFNKC